MSRLAASLVLVLCGARVGAQAAPPWEAQPLTADPKEVLKAAAAAAAGDEKADVVVLYEEARYTFDAAGRCDYVYRIAYRVQTEAGLERWATIGSEWSPWFEERPELKARVIAPGGVAHVIDPKTIAEAGVNDDNPEVFSDRKRLRGPLPGLKVGAVVEQEIRSVEKAPFFAAGSSFGFSVGSSVPVRRARVVVDAPESLPLQHQLRGSEGLTVEKERAAGRVRLSLVTGPLAPLPNSEPWMPSDRPRRPHFSFSTGASWAAVAEAYARLVDAQIAVPAPAALKAAVKREEVAARLVKRLHEEIRYTGVEFAEAAIVPRPPAEVMARKYGDCKDKSALLVSRLRAEGIPAFLALLRTGPGTDVSPTLPGLGSFDHAIVMMPGTPNLWVDATDEFARVNQLSPSVQDRWALVAAPGTTALVRIPASATADNVLRKTREYRLAAAGLGSVVETTRASGTIERSYRRYFARMDAKALQEQQQKYSAAEHHTGGAVAVKNADPRDLSGPFEVRLESKEAGRAETSEGAALVTIAPGGLFTELPDYIGALPADGGPEGPRREPFVLSEPHRVEWTYKIVPPPGFVVKRLPDPEKVPLGGASLDVRFEPRPDGSVEGRLVFDSGPRVLEPKAFDALHNGVKKWREREPFKVEFEDRVLAMLEGGKTAEALTELRRAALLQPKAAAPRLRLAEALLQSGFGESAREEARKAVTLEPGSAEAQRLLGWTLEHDALGRRFKKGFDRAGAESAYRKAKELDPKSVIVRASLAILYEHNDQGVHFGPGANMAAGLLEGRALKADLGGGGLDTNIMLDLLKLGRFEELEAFARALPDGASRNEFLVVAVAARRGTKAAVLEAVKLFSDPAARREGLLHAGNSLIELRLYPEGSALLAESVAGAKDAAERRARADLFARVKRYEDVKLPEGDPKTVVKRLFILLAEHFAVKGDPARLLEVIAATDDDRRTLARDAESLRREVTRSLRRAGAGDAPFGPGLVDIIVSLGEFVSEGDHETGFRVRMKVGEHAQSAYVVWRDGFKVLASQSAPDLLAGEAWRLLDRGNVVGAGRWLDWMRDEMTPSGGEDPLANPAFLRLWRPGGDRGGDAARIAAASLFASADRVAKGLQATLAWRQAQTDPAAQRDLDVALVELYARGGHLADLVKVLERVQVAYPASTSAFGARVSALGDLGRGAEARALIDDRLKKNPDDALSLRLLAQQLLRQGQFDAVEKTYARMAEVGRCEGGDWNNRAWNAVLRGVVDDAALEWGQKAVQLAKTSAATLHTLATLYAEKGRTREAYQVLLQSLEYSALEEPGSAEWYVVGRLAEHCGLQEFARTAYARVDDKSNRLDSTAVLARRAAARLSGAAPQRRASR